MLHWHTRCCILSVKTSQHTRTQDTRGSHMFNCTTRIYMCQKDISAKRLYYLVKTENMLSRVYTRTCQASNNSIACRTTKQHPIFSWKLFQSTPQHWIQQNDSFAPTALDWFSRFFFLVSVFSKFSCQPEGSGIVSDPPWSYIRIPSRDSNCNGAILTLQCWEGRTCQRTGGSDFWETTKRKEPPRSFLFMASTFLINALNLHYLIPSIP